MFEVKKTPTKVAICGTGSGWELLPKITDQTIYCLNDYLFTEKYGIQPDLLFILDILDEKPQIVAGVNNLGDVINRINKLKIPLIAPYQYEEIPLSKPFPLKECVEKFGLPYFSNTICFMIAYALLNGAKEISLYGINQASSAEYFHERDAVTYWLGVANGMGVKVTINGDKSELLRGKDMYGGTLLYGYKKSYDEIMRTEQRLGGQIVKRLMSPSKQYSRTVRKINFES